MTKRTVLVSLVAVGAIAAVAAPMLQKPPQMTGMMADAQFIVGTWEGEGWMMTQTGRHEATVKEVITPRVGGTVMSLEGLGKDKASGEVVHDAFGVLFYDPIAKAHRMRSFTQNGTGEFPATVKKGEIVWNLTSGPRQIKFTIKLDDQGRWHEIGEVEINGQWTKMFEMTLKKVG